jgi:signal transduction histidine kinase
VEFGAGTLAYGIVAGASAAIALVLLVLWLPGRRRDHVPLALGAVGLIGAIGAIAAVRLQSSTSLADYAEQLKVFGFINLLAVVGFVALATLWSRSVAAWLTAVFYVASAMVAVLQAALPEGLLAADLTGLREVQLFGETFVVHEGGASPWRAALYAYLAVTIGVIVVALTGAARSGHRQVTRVLVVCVAILTLFVLYDSLVDEGVASTPYLLPFGQLVTVAFTAGYVILRVQEADRRLERHAETLEQTVLARTAALMATNERLEETISQQRTSAVHLAELARHFERVNALTLAQPERIELEVQLEEVLGDLGRLVGANSVSLTVETPEGPNVLTAPVRWSAPAAGGADGADDRGDAERSAAVVERLSVRGRRLGQLEITIEPGRLDDTGRRHIKLTAEHFAGFVERIELADKIANTAAVAERERIARDLHDSVTQKLYAASFLADAVPGQLDGDTDGAAQTTRRLREILLMSLAELRALLFELRPDVLDKTRLPQLLEQLCDTFGTASSVDVQLRRDECPLLPQPARVGLYRVAQEAVTNAVRHSGADTDPHRPGAARRRCRAAGQR